jgi:hypothetical protein
MKYFVVIGLAAASLSFAAPVKKAPAKKVTAPAATTTTTTASDTAAPVTTAPATTAPADTTLAAPATAPAATTTTAAVQAPTEAKVTGILETRPTATFVGTDGYTTENTIGLGYQFNPNFELGAVQYFDTNLSNGRGRTGNQDVFVQDGFLRAKFNNLYKTESFSFSYEPRAYLPTKRSAREAGMITTVRNYLKFAYKASDSVTLTAMELPIFHFYDNAGTAGSANPGFENRVYLIADFNLGGGFAFSLPVYFHQLKFRTLTGAANSGKWDFFVYTWPELTYAVTDNVTLGVAYRSENLMTSDMSSFTFDSGFNTGAVQAIMAVTL